VKILFLSLAKKQKQNKRSIKKGWRLGREPDENTEMKERA
jgi:hypothetical protein